MVVSAVFFFLFLLMVGPVSALTITDQNPTTVGLQFDVDLNDGAYITDSAADSNLFNQELFTSGDEEKSGTVLFSKIPYFDFESSRYFQFVYDMQETGGGGKQQLSIDDIVISAAGGDIPGGQIIWRLDLTNAAYAPIVLNSAEPFTSTPLNAGGDMELYVPVSLFVSYGLTGSDSLTLTVKQSLSDNGTDEWVVLGSGSGGNYFGPHESIVVPIPPAVWLFGTGLLGLGLLGRRRKNRT